MSGVVDKHGQQWEHCNNCGKWVKIQKLYYEKKSAEHAYGRDLCAQCVMKGPTFGEIEAPHKVKKVMLKW